ncbi:MAG: dTDP-4-dehydrorhamnose 3,5-epimerase family protein [Polyangiaceae bacterium]
MIDGVIISPRKIIPDDRGKVLHMLKRTDPEFQAFGEIYFSTIYPGVVKGWHLHREMVINYVVPVGMIKLVLYDDRKGSKTHGEIQEIYIGEQNHVLVVVPVLVWNGFKCVGPTPAVVANCATIPHDPKEIERLDPHKSYIPYDWALKDR